MIFSASLAEPLPAYYTIRSSSDEPCVVFATLTVLDSAFEVVII